MAVCLCVCVSVSLCLCVFVCVCASSFILVTDGLVSLADASRLLTQRAYKALLSRVTLTEDFSLPLSDLIVFVVSSIFVSSSIVSYKNESAGSIGY